jgi:hypothetical protein
MSEQRREWNPHPTTVAFVCGAYCGALGVVYLVMLWLFGYGGSMTITFNPR